MKGVDMIESSVDVKKAASQVKEGEFVREIPSYLDLLDFY